MKASKVGDCPGLTLDEWVVKIGGTPKAAKLIGVARATVNFWRAGHCYPRVDQMKRIRKLSRGLVTYEAMIDRAGRR
jgi:DNA-binding transcriptional regulator YdaS (Cro superfamily)